MLEPHGVDYNYVMSNSEIEGKRWYQYYTWTYKEFDEFKVWAIEQIMKSEAIDRRVAQNKFEYFIMSYGLRIVSSK